MADPHRDFPTTRSQGGVSARTARRAIARRSLLAGAAGTGLAAAVGALGRPFHGRAEAADETSVGDASLDWLVVPVRDFPLLVSGYPRLYFTAEDLPGLRALAADTRPTPVGPSGQTLWGQIALGAQDYVDDTEFTVGYIGGVSRTYPLPPVEPEPYPPPPGYGRPYPYRVAMATNLRSRMQALTLAHLVTQEDRYAEVLREYVVSLSSWLHWHDPDVVGDGITNLDTTDITMAFCFAYDCVDDLLSEQERSAALESLENLAAIPLFEDCANPTDSNKGLARAGALGTAGVILLGVSPNANAYLTRATDVFAWYLDRRRTSGQQEGHLYTAFAIDAILTTADHIARASGVDDTFTDPYVDASAGDSETLRLIDWVLYSLAPGAGSLPALSDSQAAKYYFVTASLMAERLGNPHAAWFLANVKPLDTSNVITFLYADPDGSTGSLDDLPRSKVLTGIGQAALRSGWEASDVALIFVANNSPQGHNHFDQNSFLIGTNNIWVADDPGYQDALPGPGNEFGVYFGHSTIHVDGEPQVVRGGGHMTAGVVSDAVSYVKGEAAAAYADSTLTRFDRHIVFVSPHYYVVFDDIEATSDHAYDWLLYVGGDGAFRVDDQPVVVGEAVAGSRLWLNKSVGQLAATFISESDVSISVQEYPGAERYGPFVTVASGAPSSRGTFLTVVQAGPYQVPGLLQAEDHVDLNQSSGRDTRVLSITGSSVQFYRSQAVGDFLGFTFSLDEPGTYTCRIWFGMATSYGTVQASVDGQPVGDPYDCYAGQTQLGDPHPLGDLELSDGEHHLQVTVVGKNDASGTYYFSVDALQVVRPDQDTDPPELEPLAATPVTGDGGRGTIVTRPDRSGIQDLVLFRTGDRIAVDDTQSDGVQVVISRDEAGRIERYAVTDGMYLRDQQQTLVAASSACHAALVYDDAAAEAAGTVEVSQDQWVTLYAPEPRTVEVDGVELSRRRYVYRRGTRLLTLNLTRGAHSLRITS